VTASSPSSLRYEQLIVFTCLAFRTDLSAGLQGPQSLKAPQGRDALASEAGRRGRGWEGEQSGAPQQDQLHPARSRQRRWARAAAAGGAPGR